LTQQTLSPDETHRRLHALNLGALSPAQHWLLDDGRLHRRFEFVDFATAFAFMRRVAEVATLLNHPPDWRNVHRHVDVALYTHDAGGITALDFALAERINDVHPLAH
jgi:4a-hydroxytetrahydrobiopterin dehydratase